MENCCVCACGPFKPKWRKLVDDLFAKNSEANAMQRLTYFSLTKPDKLNRVSEYLRVYLEYYLNHKNHPLALYAMDAIDSLIMASQAPKLNLFAANFLSMVQLLLESNVVPLMLRGCKSFLEFSKIEEDTPNYHREYDDLLKHFVALCYISNLNSAEDLENVRRGGIQGIGGILRKTSSDKLQIFNTEKFSIIIPCLIFNMSNCFENGVESDLIQESSSVFEIVVQWTSRNDIKPVVVAILEYFDKNDEWQKTAFVNFIFQKLTLSCKNSQSAHRIVKVVVEHLNSHKINSRWEERVQMVHIIGDVVIYLAKSAVGPDVFHNFKSLLQILRVSIERVSAVSFEGNEPVFQQITLSMNGEMQFQNAVVSIIAEFAKNLPDTQKMEILKFMLNYEPINNFSRDRRRDSDALLKLLLKTMLLVAKQYKTISISNAFSNEFLSVLLGGAAQDSQPEVRATVQLLLQTLIDRHDNSSNLAIVETHPMESLKDKFKWIQPQREDVIFMKKTGQLLMAHLYQQLLNPSNQLENLEKIYSTLCLLALELSDPEVLVELFRFVLEVQNTVLVNELLRSESKDSNAVGGSIQQEVRFATSADNGGMGDAVDFTFEVYTSAYNQLSVSLLAAIHALLAAVSTLLCQLLTSDSVKPLQEHIFQVVEYRKQNCALLLPSVVFNRTNFGTTDIFPTVLLVNKSALFDSKLLASYLTMAGCDVTKLGMAYQKPCFQVFNREVVASGSNLISRSESEISIDSDSRQSSLLNIPVSMNELSFDYMKKIINEPQELAWQRKKEEEDNLINYFRINNLDQICNNQREQKNQSMQMQIFKIFANSDLKSEEAVPNNCVSSRLRKHSASESLSDSTISVKSHQSEAESDNFSLCSHASDQNFSNRKFGNSPLSIWDIQYPKMFIS